MAMFEIKNAAYNKLIRTAVKVRDENRFFAVNDLPTIEDLVSHNIVPDPDKCEMDIDILGYLVFYAEQECIDEEEDEWDYIYKPDPDTFTDDEIRDFYEVRKYIEKVLVKTVNIK